MERERAEVARLLVSSVDFPPGGGEFIDMDFSYMAQLGDDLGRMAEIARDSQQETRDISLTIGEPRTLHGVEGFVLEGQGPNGQYYESGGLNADNVLITLCFIIPNGLDLKE